MIGPLEYLDRGRPPLHCRVEGTEPVRAQDREHREPINSHPVDAAQQGIHPGPVLVMHLGEFPGLGQGIGLVDEQDTETGGDPVTSPRPGEVCGDALESAG